MKYTYNSKLRKVKLMNPVSWGVVCGFYIYRSVTGCTFLMEVKLEIIKWPSTYMQSNVDFQVSQTV